jgi:RsiW-degrading membrane proteinase PrsW (M82 family)
VTFKNNYTLLLLALSLSLESVFVYGVVPESLKIFFLSVFITFFLCIARGEKERLPSRYMWEIIPIVLHVIW